MNQKEIKKKVEDMYAMLIVIQDAEKSGLDKSVIDKTISSLLEILVYGIIAKDLVQELNLNEDLNVAFHEVGYHHGINEEYMRRINVCMKKLNKKL